MDQANFKGTEAEKIRLAEEKERAITDFTKTYEQQRRDFAMQSAQQVSDAAFSILKNGMQAQSAARLKTLDTQKCAELNNFLLLQHKVFFFVNQILYLPINLAK